MVETETIDINALTKSNPCIVVGIPAFNEEQTIVRVILGAQRFADVVIVCDDGSSDLTATIAEKLGAVVIRHDKNYGKGWALKSIFKEAVKFKPDIMVTIDSDGQHDPSEIPDLIRPLINGQTDVVLGSRYVAESAYKIPRYRKIGLFLINWLNKRANHLNVRDTQNGFRAYNSKALKVVSSFESNGFSVESEQIILAGKDGLRIKEVPISTKYAGLARTSKKSPLTHGMGLVGYILKVMVEEKPLIFLGIPGTIFLFIGALFGVWMLQIYSFTHGIVTNVALASIAFIFLGFFCLFGSITLYAISRISQKINQTLQKIDEDAK
jgi:glycosyltransferase involved in cell wall biosynthesis